MVQTPEEIGDLPLDLRLPHVLCCSIQRSVQQGSLSKCSCVVHCVPVACLAEDRYQRMPIRELSVDLVLDIVESYGQITKLNLSTNGE